MKFKIVNKENQSFKRKQKFYQNKRKNGSMRNQSSIPKEKEVKLKDIASPKISPDKSSKVIYYFIKFQLNQRKSKINSRNSKHFINIQIK